MGTTAPQTPGSSSEPPSVRDPRYPLLVHRVRPPRRPLLPRTLIAAVLGGAAVLALVLAILTWRAVGVGIVVPDLVGLSEGVARTRLAQAGLELGSVERRFDPQPQGRVLAQSPSPGARLPRGGSIAVVVSAGTEEFRMPDVIGKQIAIARAQLEQLGLVVQIEAVPSERLEDTVLETIPGPRAQTRTSDVVRIRVAAPIEPTDLLLPFELRGTVFVIDPAPVPGGEGDPALEVTRRLRSLLEASGATVIVTRAAGEPPVPVATRAQRAQASATPITAVVGIDVGAEMPAGLRVAVPEYADMPPAQRAASEGLAAAVLAGLSEIGAPVPQIPLGSDPVAAATSAPFVRVTLGALLSPEDVAAFRDPRWSDTVARSLYRTLGERYGTTP